MGNCKAALVALPLLFLIPRPVLLGQTKPPASSATISVDVNLVLLHVTVRDKTGGFVSGLDKENFQVFEDGARQTIRFFQHEDVPVAVGLIVDNSG
jgi:Ca-activated chloride channel homolog